MDHLALEGLQRSRQGIPVQKTQDYGSLVIGKGFRRPFYEFGKVKQEGGLHLTRLLSPGGRLGAHQNDEQKYGYDEKLVFSLIRSEKYYEMIAGRIEFDEYWPWFESQLPSNYDPEIIKNEWFEA